MPDKLFFVDPFSAVSYTYTDLLDQINATKYLETVCATDSPYTVFKSLLVSLIAGCPIHLNDGGADSAQASSVQAEVVPVQINPVSSWYELIERVNRVGEWRISLQTSGTTGIPKTVLHSVGSLTRLVKTGEKYVDNVWGFAYHPAHMAGLQVFFQAFMNNNTIVNLFSKEINRLIEAIRTYQITHISASPTYYRQIPLNGTAFPSVQRITFGGESASDELKAKLRAAFPNARFANIYASTEAGSLLSSDGEYFIIDRSLADSVKIIDHMLFVHVSVLGHSENITTTDGWYNTQDLIEWNSGHTAFRIIGRMNDLINVGGYKVNPQEVEQQILCLSKVQACKVYGKPNSVTGNIVYADIVKSDESLTELELKTALNASLPKYSVPRIINFVSELQCTRTGKLKRNE